MGQTATAQTLRLQPTSNALSRRQALLAGQWISLQFDLQYLSASAGMVLAPAAQGRAQLRRQGAQAALAWALQQRDCGGSAQLADTTALLLAHGSQRLVGLGGDRRRRRPGRRQLSYEQLLFQGRDLHGIPPPCGAAGREGSHE